MHAKSKKKKKNKAENVKRKKKYIEVMYLELPIVHRENASGLEVGHQSVITALANRNDAWHKT